MKILLRFFLPLALGVFLMWWVFKEQDFQGLADSLAKANYSWLLLSIACGLLSHLVRAMRWKVLMQPLGYQPTLWNTFHAVMVGYIANLAFPRMGEVSKCGSLAKKETLAVDKLLGTVVVERLWDLISLLVISLVVVFFNLTLFSRPILDFVASKSGTINWWALAFIAVFVLVFLVSIPWMLRLIRKKAGGNAWFIRLNDFVRGISEGFKAFKKMEQKGLFLLLTSFIWLLYWLMVYLCVFSIEATSNMDINDGWMLLVVGSFGIVAPVQGGIGAYHAIMVAFLTHLPHRTIVESDALVFATLSHANQTVMIIVVGFISLLIMFFSPNRKGHVNQK
jgi:uncharacterized protein (TIRG00374 family)